jgi:hypothetical protein
MPIDLVSAPIPPKILARLQPHHERLKSADYLEHFYDDEDIASIIRALNERCMREGIVGYHYTRSFAERLLANGLVATSGEARRRSFIDEFGHLFSRTQLHVIEVAWSAYFDRQQNRGRDDRVWFNLTLDALTDSGAEPLLRHYGGEVVYKPLASHPSIATILKSIGEPLVVSCALDATTLTTFAEWPWGKAWLGSYHLTLNPHACRVDFDVYTPHSVSRGSIIRVQRASEYGWK